MPDTAAQDHRVLLFDLGGVLVESTGHAALGRYLPHLAPEAIRQRWIDSVAVQQFERGAILADGFARSFLAEWQMDLEPSRFLREFSTWVGGFLPGAEQLLSRLKTRHRIGCLSNTNATHWVTLGRIRHAFEPCIASHLTGYLKPDHTAFAHAVKLLGVDARSVYFFDDLLCNVDAARRAGINACCVQGVSETESALRDLGFHTADAA
ncbi:MAG TPA: HAD-IA family hydrolase [Pirellulales bacterium]|nr:HAD-IA family hydrolase [Pirellulales bacterium]